MRLSVNIDVDDLAKAESFYTRAFGLKVDRRFGSDFVELVGAEVPIYLLAKKTGSQPFAGSTVARDYARHWTPVHLDFSVEDLEAAIERAVQAGARRESEIADDVWGRIAYLSDPFGHGFCLLQMKPGGYDTIMTGRGST
jgi:predicted enzyme related to lactoylglutathione lyase